MQDFDLPTTATNQSCGIIFQSRDSRAVIHNAFGAVVASSFGTNQSSMALDHGKLPELESAVFLHQYLVHSYQAQLDLQDFFHLADKSDKLKYQGCCQISNHKDYQEEYT